jgi:hypothetical protein
MNSIFIFLDRIYPASLNKPFGQEALDRPSYAEARRIDGIFFACGERPFGQKPMEDGRSLRYNEGR